MDWMVRNGKGCALDDGINHYGQVLSGYLGRYFNHMQQLGSWLYEEPKKPVVKHNQRKREIVEFRGSMGWKEFVPQD